MELESYLAELASAAPAPGGGSAAALVVALGASLVAMVARITLGNAAYAERHALARDLVVQADTLRAQALAARVEDEAAYSAVVAASALPKTTPDERTARTARLQAALTVAAAAPLAAAHLAKLVAVSAERALALDNAALASDLGCAAEFARAGLAAAALNVRVNHLYMKDAAAVAAQSAKLECYERDTASLVSRVRCELGRAHAR